jgi:hypothetical protein
MPSSKDTHPTPTTDDQMHDATANEIKRLRVALALADRVIYRLELGGEPWSVELMEARDQAINRIRATQGKGPI